MITKLERTPRNTTQTRTKHKNLYNAFNVYRRELAPGTVSLTGDRAQGDDSKHWAYYSTHIVSNNKQLINNNLKRMTAFERSSV